MPRTIHKMPSFSVRIGSRFPLLLRAIETLYKRNHLDAAADAVVVSDEDGQGGSLRHDDFRLVTTETGFFVDRPSRDLVGATLDLNTASSMVDLLRLDCEDCPTCFQQPKVAPMHGFWK
jgi:hypothetical protein